MWTIRTWDLPQSIAYTCQDLYYQNWISWCPIENMAVSDGIQIQSYLHPKRVQYLQWNCWSYWKWCIIWHIKIEFVLRQSYQFNPRHLQGNQSIPNGILDQTHQVQKHSWHSLLWCNFTTITSTHSLHRICASQQILHVIWW